MILVLITLSVVFLAYCNGANDNFKGIATVWGSGLLNYKNALICASIATFFGAMVSLYFSQTLLKNFSGKGLVPDAIVYSPVFVLAVALGAAFTILLATSTGFPISTTHSLVGALVGAGYCAAPGQVDLTKLVKTFFLPLILSPVLAFVLSILVYCFNKKMRNYLNKRLLQFLFYAHLLTAVVVCFSHGLNDTPKMAGLLNSVSFFEPKTEIFILGIMMLLGGLFFSKKVAQTISHNITKLSNGQGFSANLVTSILVILASTQGLPVSFTHISVGSLIGIGVVNKQADFSEIGKILLSWAITLPLSAFLAALLHIFINFLS
jgi:inorganic phosphate transporter, PiT family